MFNKIFLLVLLLVCGFSIRSYAEEVEEVVFSGTPIRKISESGIDRVVEDVNEEKAIEFKCTITKISDKYFWTTRNNLELIPMESGAFITFVATSGAGYVRIVLPKLKDRDLMDIAEKQYDYVEHMLIGLKSVTYFGKSR